MTSEHLLVPTDFSPAAQNALEIALNLAKSNNLGVCLFHVDTKDSIKLLQNNGLNFSSAGDAIETIAANKSASSGVTINSCLATGNVLDEINSEARDPKYKMTVIGTHGTRGLRQNLFGADMLRLAKDSPIPVLTVSEDGKSELSGTSIVIPYGAHSDYKNLVESSAFIAQSLGLKVYIFGVRRTGDTISDQTRNNVKDAMDILESKGLNAEEIFRESGDFSIGFSSEILKFSEEVNASFISLMNRASEEHAYISKVDKERLLNNDKGIGLLISPL